MLAVLVIVILVVMLARTVAGHMQARGIQSGFDFLLGSAGFDIGESLIPFDSLQPYWMAYLVGLTNTLRVAILGIVLASILGTLIGIGRLSKSILLRGVCSVYVEFFRNIPLLLQLLVWYLLFTELLPDSQTPWHTGPFFLSKGGLSFPIPTWGAGLGWDMPVLGEFAVEHGGSLTPEFLALLVGLSTYTAAFIAEVVRSGLQSVALGQSEAAHALGLSRSQTLRKVLLPQALQVIIPPMTSQYLNLTKNSSLAVAIGYPDVVSIANTAINQTGRAVECIALVMLVYLSTSLITSWLMARYEARIALQER